MTEQRQTREVESKAPEPLAVPTIHLNGTGKRALMAALEASHHAIGHALEAMGQTAPNGRDYYTQPAGALERAQLQHKDRLLAVLAVQAELYSVWEAIDES